MEPIPINEALKKGRQKGNVRVRIRGWCYRERKLAGRVFIVMRDYSNIIQCLIEKSNVNKKVWDDANKITIESSLYIEGELKRDERAPTGFEVVVSDLEIVHIAEPFPIAKDLSYEFLLNKRHLWLRSRYMNAIMKVRSNVFGAIHEFFRDRGYFEFQSPSFTPSACEGGSTLFKVDYFGKNMYLTQSWQLYAETGIFSLEKIYCIAPSFRAERSKTSRHLAEYWHAEVETAWMQLDGLLDLAEDCVKHVVKSVLEKNRDELKILKRDVSKLEPVVSKKFMRLTYDEVLEILRKNGVNIKWGKDLRTIEEDKISELYDVPVMITRYPMEVKAFYMKADEKNSKVALCVDVIAPEGYGEIIGGSERETSFQELVKRLKEQGEDIKNYEFFLDMRRYGSVQHAGFGMGVERLVSWICGVENIKDAIPFPRTMERYYP